MKKPHLLRIALLSLGLFATSVIAPLSAQAQQAAGSGIVTINIQEILNESLAAKSAKKQIDDKRDEYQKELKTLENNLLKEQKSIQEQRSVLSPEALGQKAKEFEAKMTEAQKNQQDKRERIASANNLVLGDIQAALMKIVPAIAQAKGAKVVALSNTLLWATPDLDITKEVMAQLDKELPSVKVNFNAPTGKK